MGRKKKYRTGIIGCGRIAGFLENDYLRVHPCTHAGVYSLVDKINLVACASRYEATVNKFAAKFNIPHRYTDYKEMLDGESLDIVSICTPAPLHYEMVKEAAQHRVKAVFCEKAIASSLKEADKMIKLCEKSNVKLTINHTRRWTWELQMIKKIIARGEIGELQTISGYFGGNLIHTGTHFFDILSFLAGPPESITGGLSGVKRNFLKDSGYRNYPEQKIKDYDGYGLIIFKNGVVATLCGLGKEYFLFEIDIQGSKGRIRLGNNGVLELWKKAKSLRYVGFRELKRCPFPQPKKTKNSWLMAVDDILKSIAQDKDTASTGKDARIALEMALAIHISHSRGLQKVCLPLKGRERKFRIVSK